MTAERFKIVSLQEVPVRFLLRLVPNMTEREQALATVRGVAVSLGVEARNPKWTSYGGLEVDIFAPTRADFDLFLAATGPVGRVEFARDLNVAPEYKSDDALVSEAREYFNHERYWECHEVLEGLWRVKEGAEKNFLQGFILVCAAYVHHQKGEDAVGLGILRRALKQLAYEGGEYRGIVVRRIFDEVQMALASETFNLFWV